MTTRDTWVELGRGSLVRADAIQKIETHQWDSLRVKVIGERDERWLTLDPPGRYPLEWNPEDVERFEDSRNAPDLGRALIDAIADAASGKGGFEIALRISLDAKAAGWALRHTGNAADPEQFPGLCFWEGFPSHGEFDGDEDEPSE